MRFGFWIWIVNQTEGGDVLKIAAEGYQLGLEDLYIKIADGVVGYNIDTTTKRDLANDLIAAAKALGIRCWGWQYVYGANPEKEAEVAVRRIRELGIDGFVVDAEQEYKRSDGASRANRYMKALRGELPDFPIGLTSYRFPRLHPEFPWSAFLSKVDFNMPQVYWEQAHNPSAQLRRCLSEFTALSPGMPVYPIGATYKNGGWAPTREDVRGFINESKANNLEGVSFWSWQHCRRDLPHLWDVIGEFSQQLPETPQPVDLPSEKLENVEKQLNKLHELTDEASATIAQIRQSLTDKGLI